jgi:hypothetical protein
LSRRSSAKDVSDEMGYIWIVAQEDEKPLCFIDSETEPAETADHGESIERLEQGKN